MNPVYCMSEEKISPTCKIKKNRNDTEEHKMYNYLWNSNIILDMMYMTTIPSRKVYLKLTSIPPPPKNNNKWSFNVFFFLSKIYERLPYSCCNLFNNSSDILEITLLCAAYMAIKSKMASPSEKNQININVTVWVFGFFYIEFNKRISKCMN